MSIAKAVKEAIDAGLGDFWMLNLPEAQKAAYYGGTIQRRRENRDESSDFVIVKVAEAVLKKDGIRGLCF